MQMETLTLPKEVVSAARSYARRERKTVEDIVVNALKLAYGIEYVYVVDARVSPKANCGTPSAVHRLRDMRRTVRRDDNWLDED